MRAGETAARASVTSRRLGIDQTNVYVTADEFSINGPQFFGSQMWAIDKADLVAGKPLTHFVRFSGLTIAGQQTIAPQPALTTAKPKAEYFLSSMDPTGQGDHQIGVWAMTRRGQVGKGGIPTLTSTVINSEAYANPPKAAQKGGKSKLDSGDDRMQETQFSGGTVWGELTTAVQPAGDTAVRAGGAWFQVRPRLGAGRDRRRVDRPAGLHRLPRPVRDLPVGAAGRGRERGGRLHPDRPQPVPERRLRHPEGRGSQLRAAGRGRVRDRDRTSGSRPAGATTPSRCRATRRTPPGWPPSTSRPSPARPPTGNRTGGRGSSRSRCPDDRRMPEPPAAFAGGGRLCRGDQELAVSRARGRHGVSRHPIHRDVINSRADAGSGRPGSLAATAGMLAVLSGRSPGPG